MAREGFRLCKQAVLYAAEETEREERRETAEEPQVLNNLPREHLEENERETVRDAEREAPDEMDVEFHKQGSIGILFEVRSQHIHRMHCTQQTELLATVPPSVCGRRCQSTLQSRSVRSNRPRRRRNGAS